MIRNYGRRITCRLFQSDNSVKTAEGLKKDVQMIESSIGEKKKQLEKLVQEMKEVNLQSLTVSTDEASPVGEGKQSTRSISRFTS